MIQLTQSTTFIIGPVAKVLGYIMNAIFNLLDLINIPNSALAIFLFTIVIYMLLTPLTYKQQKFSKLSAKMNPELQAVQSKYKGRKDEASVMAMNQETQAVYAKYGASPTGTCLPLLIQMPILFSLYRVIYNMPAYVTKIKEAFLPLVSKMITMEGATEFIQNTENFSSASLFSKQFTNEAFTSGTTEYVQNTFIDVLNRASTAEFSNIANVFPDLSNEVTSVSETLATYNNLFVLNIGNSPSFMIKEFFANGQYFFIVIALLVPILAGLTQLISIKIMPQAAQQTASGAEPNQMASTMKMMNYTMPILSIVMCYTLPTGMGLYWIAGAVVRTIQQIIINKHIDKVDLDELIKKNVEKRNKKLEKAGITSQTIANNARMSTRNVNTTTDISQPTQASSTSGSSLSSKANMVRDYNARNNK